MYESETQRVKSKRHKGIEPEKLLCRIPAALKLETIIKAFPKLRTWQNAVYVISHLQQRYLFSSQHELDQFISVNSESMRKVVNNDFTKIMHWLLSSDICETDDTYIPGYKSRGWRFTEAYRGDTQKITLHNTLLARRAKAQREGFFKDGSHERIKEQTKNHTLDFEQAYIACERYYEEDLAKHGKEKADLRYNFAIAALDELRAGQWRFKLDSPGRFHHNLSNLPKRLRCYIKGPDGQSLIEKDIKNSQPFFWACFLHMLANEDMSGKKSYWAWHFTRLSTEGEAKKRIKAAPQSIWVSYKDKEGQDRRKRVAWGVKALYRYHRRLIWKLIVLAREAKSEIAKLKASCESGNFYREFGKEAEANGDASFNKKLEEDYDAAKRCLYTIFFMRNLPIDTKDQASWRAAYPKICQMGQLIKRVHHPLLAKLLQFYEAKHVVNEGLASLQDVPSLIGIHDSVLVSAEHEERAQRAIETCMTQKPAVGTTDYKKLYETEKAKNKAWQERKQQEARLANIESRRARSISPYEKLAEAAYAKSLEPTAARAEPAEPMHRYTICLRFCHQEVCKTTQIASRRQRQAWRSVRIRQIWLKLYPRGPP